ENRRAIRGASEVIAGRIEALSPGVVGKLMEKLERRAVGFESIGAHCEVEQLASDRAFESRVADAAVQPIVVAVVKVARLRVSVANAPAFHDDLTYVGFVVAVRVLEEEATR